MLVSFCKDTFHIYMSQYHKKLKITKINCNGVFIEMEMQGAPCKFNDIWRSQSWLSNLFLLLIWYNENGMLYCKLLKVLYECTQASKLKLDFFLDFFQVSVTIIVRLHISWWNTCNCKTTRIRIHWTIMMEVSTTLSFCVQLYLLYNDWYVLCCSKADCWLSLRLTLSI